MFTADKIFGRTCNNYLELGAAMRLMNDELVPNEQRVIGIPRGRVSDVVKLLDFYEMDSAATVLVDCDFNKASAPVGAKYTCSQWMPRKGATMPHPRRFKRVSGVISRTLSWESLFLYLATPEALSKLVPLFTIRSRVERIVQSLRRASSLSQPHGLGQLESVVMSVHRRHLEGNCQQLLNEFITNKTPVCAGGSAISPEDSVARLTQSCNYRFD